MAETQLDGSVALVTGGASGIGQATSVALASSGAAIAVVDRQREAGAATVAAIVAAGGTARAFGADLAAVNESTALVRDVLATFGRIDILVNCAGIAGVPGEPSGATTFSDSAYEQVMAVNLRAPFVLTREVGRHMVQRGGGGRIVNVSSSAAFQARLVPAVYAASKAGLNALTRTAAAELAPHGVIVNAVAPGVTKTPIVGVGVSDAEYDSMVSSGPLENLTHRASEPEDVASVIRFLCLPDSREITGQVVHTSAGLIV